MGLTSDEEAALASYNIPVSRKVESWYRHTPLAPVAIERIRRQHQPGLNYGRRGPGTPSCRQCGQSWPCDASRLLDTLPVAREGRERVRCPAQDLSGDQCTKEVHEGVGHEF